MTSWTCFVLLSFLVSNYFMNNKYTVGPQSYMGRHGPDIVGLSTHSFSPTPVLKYCLLDTKYIKLTFYFAIQWTTNIGLLTFSSVWYFLSIQEMFLFLSFPWPSLSSAVQIPEAVFHSDVSWSYLFPSWNRWRVFTVFKHIAILSAKWLLLPS